MLYAPHIPPATATKLTKQQLQLQLSRATHSDGTYHGIIAFASLSLGAGQSLRSLVGGLQTWVSSQSSLYYHLLNHNSHWRLRLLLRLPRHSATESQAMLKRAAHSQTKSAAQSGKASTYLVL